MFQQLLFDKILKKYSTQAEALTVISELLFLNKSNVYRRLSGAIALKPQEIEVLAKHYELSLDELIYEKSDKALGQMVSGGQRDHGKNYILSSISRLKHLSKTPNFQFTYSMASNDLSPIYYAHYPELFYFKVLQWERLLWRVEGRLVFNFEER